MATRKDSNTARIHAFEAASSGPALEWPKSVNLPTDKAEAAEVKSYFNEVLLGRQKEHWAPFHAALVADLSLLMLQKRKLTQDVAEEGATVVSEKGWASRNPKLDALSTISALVSQNLKALGLVGAVREADRKAAGEKDAAAKPRRSGGLIA